MEQLQTALHKKPTINNLGTYNSVFIYFQESPYAMIKGQGWEMLITYFMTVPLLDQELLYRYASKDLNMWLVPEFTTGDMTTCMWKTEDDRDKGILIASIQRRGVTPSVGETATPLHKEEERSAVAL